MLESVSYSPSAQAFSSQSHGIIFALPSEISTLWRSLSQVLTSPLQSTMKADWWTWRIYGCRCDAQTWTCGCASKQHCERKGECIVGSCSNLQRSLSQLVQLGLNLLGFLDFLGSFHWPSSQFLSIPHPFLHLPSLSPLFIPVIHRFLLTFLQFFPFLPRFLFQEAEQSPFSAQVNYS